MEIHRPKAVNGWRDLFREVGVIVIGVTIALGAEQGVDALHWMHQTDVAETTLKSAYIREVQNAALREAQGECVAQRLAYLSSIVQQASESGRLPAIADIGHPPYTPWTIGAWDALVASQTVSHLPAQRMIAYTTITQRTAFLSDLSDREEEQWTILNSIVGPARRLSDAEAEELRTTLAKASDSNLHMRKTSGALRDLVRDTHLLNMSDFAEAARQAVMSKQGAVICHAIIGLAEK